MNRYYSTYIHCQDTITIRHDPGKNIGAEQTFSSWSHFNKLLTATINEGLLSYDWWFVENPGDVIFLGNNVWKLSFDDFIRYFLLKYNTRYSYLDHCKEFFNSIDFIIILSSIGNSGCLSIQFKHLLEPITLAQ